LDLGFPTEPMERRRLTDLYRRLKRSGLQARLGEMGLMPGALSARADGTGSVESGGDY